MLRHRLCAGLHARCARALCTTTNIGHLRLAFNVGAGDHVALRARVFDTPTGRAFMQRCPMKLGALQAWGDEVYGCIGGEALPATRPQPLIPVGGLAYSERGNFLCVFYGQTPAWPVDYIAQVEVGGEHLRGGRWTDLHVAVEDPLAMESY